MITLKDRINKVLISVPLYFPIRNLLSGLLTKKKVMDWEQAGKPFPPPHIIKQKVLLDYSKVYNLRILVETGTYLGDMIEAMKSKFDRIYSIEIDKDLFALANKRFKHAKM